MQFFADDERVEELEAHLLAAGGARAVAELLPLAWQLRQRDPSRALALTEEIEYAIRACGSEDAEQSRARLQIIRAEVHWLHGDLDLAELSLAAAQQIFTVLADPIGMGDCNWLAASVCHSRGDPKQRSGCLHAAQAQYEVGGELIRLAATNARLVFYSAFSDPVAARPKWQALIAAHNPMDSWVEAWVLAGEGVIASLTGQHGAAARAFLRAYEAAHRCGYYTVAANCAGNAGDSFAQLNDLAAGLQWSERALALARKIGSPSQSALACTHMGEVLRRLNRPVEAQTRLQEAREALAGLPTHTNQINVLSALADLALEVGDDSAALAWATQAEARAIAMQRREGQTKALRQQARALGHLGRTDEALVKVDASLSLAKETGNPTWQMDALRVLAELHRRHPLLGPPRGSSSSPALHHVLEALALARSIEGFFVPPELLEDAAADYAAIGDTASAYALALEAKQAQVRMHSKEASDRAMAMQVQQEMELARALEAAALQHARTEQVLAQTRAQLLELQNKALAESQAVQSTILEIGQLSTQSTDITVFLQAVHAALCRIMNAANFYVALYHPKENSVQYVYFVDEQELIPDSLQRLTLDPDGPSLTGRVIFHRRPLVITAGEVAAFASTGELLGLGPMAAHWMGYPLLDHQKNILGAIVIQSYDPQFRYSEDDQALFGLITNHVSNALEGFQSRDRLAQSLSRQSIVANFGQFALTDRGLDELINEAAMSVTRGLGVEFCKVLQHQDDHELLLVRAAIGWDVHGLGRIAIDQDSELHANLCLAQNDVVVVTDFRSDPRFTASAGEPEKVVLSGIAVMIHAGASSYGVLAVHAATCRSYTDADVQFAQSIANVLATAIERQESAERFTYLAQYDQLTGLPNRNLFRDRLTQAIARARREDGRPALLCLDLDRFKEINDTFGHETGDQVLRNVAGRLADCVRAGDTIARLGGDEFVIILDNLVTATDAEKLARKILLAFSQPTRLDSTDFYVTPSIGLAIYPEHGSDTNSLLKHADIAMYHAKNEGRNNFQLYSPRLSAVARDRVLLEGDLHKALDRDEFMLHYQAVVDLKTMRISSAEALLRWRHPERGIIAPADFIRVAEQTGLIVPIGEWVLHETCQQLKRWQTSGLHPPGIAINLSARQFRKTDLVETVAAALSHYDIDARQLKVEITESLLMENTDASIAMLYKFKEMGIQIALDDFGTGYSSLSYLRHFPIDILKIDQSFVRGVTTRVDDSALVKAMIGLAHALGLTTTAEGVEAGDQLAFLRANGCDHTQGYFFSKPISATKFADLLREDKPFSQLSQRIPGLFSPVG